MDTKKPCIAIGVVVYRRAVHPEVPIKHIRVEPSVHSFSGSTGRERIASTHHDVYYTGGNEIFVLMRATPEWHILATAYNPLDNLVTWVTFRWSLGFAYCTGAKSGIGSNNEGNGVTISFNGILIDGPCGLLARSPSNGLLTRSPNVDATERLNVLNYLEGNVLNYLKEKLTICSGITGWSESLRWMAVPYSWKKSLLRWQTLFFARNRDIQISRNMSLMMTTWICKDHLTVVKPKHHLSDSIDNAVISCFTVRLISCYLGCFFTFLAKLFGLFRRKQTELTNK